MAKSSGSCLDNRDTAVGIRHVDRVAPSIHKKLAISSPTSGGRSVGIVHSRTRTMEFYVQGWYLHVGHDCFRRSPLHQNHLAILMRINYTGLHLCWVTIHYSTFLTARLLQNCGRLARITQYLIILICNNCLKHSVVWCIMKRSKQANKQTNKQTNCMAWVREWTIPAEQPPLGCEVSANFCGKRGVM
jgi:hypothetical protein